MKRERGLAAVTALLIVAIAAAAAALMLAQQSSMLDQTSMVTARAQADAYAQAGIDWARGVLLEDGQASRADTLLEGWAQPIPALPVERAVVSGRIEDEQGKFNLNNLVIGKTPSDELIFRTLLGNLGLDPDLANPVRDWIDDDADLSGAGGAEDPYYLSLPRPYRAANRPMAQVDELYRVKGFDAAAIAKLRPYVTALPQHTKINVNTASDVVLAILVSATSREGVARLLAARATKPWQAPQDFVDAAKAAGITVPSNMTDSFDVASQFFTTRVQVAQDDVQLATDALIMRPAAGTPVGGTKPVLIWRRPRY